MPSKADIKAIRAGRRATLKADGALIDAYRATRSRTIPSGKVYKRSGKHRFDRNP
jgi:hypothetical protein